MLRLDSSVLGLWALRASHMCTALLLLGLQGDARAWPQSEPELPAALQRLARLYPRPIEGRLSIVQTYQSCCRNSVAVLDPPSAPAGPLRRGTSRWQPALQDHHRGLLTLFRQGPSAAVQTMGSGVDIASSAARANDLAALYLAAADQGAPTLGAMALEFSSQAVELEPRSPAILFNHALALERMHLVEQAANTWQLVSDVEKDPHWNAEARRRLAHLRQRARVDRGVLGQLRQAGYVAADAPWSPPASLSGPALRRDLETETLGRWAEAADTKTAAPYLAMAQSMAEFWQQRGEPLYRDQLQALTNAADSSLLTEGYRAYARGLAKRRDCSQALPELNKAISLLGASDAPMTYAARIEAAICTYRKAPAQARGELLEVLRRLEALPYPTLRARAEVMLGLCEIKAGRFSLAVAHYLRAREALESVDGTISSQVAGLLDEAHRLLGQRERAWHFRDLALASALRSGERQFRHAVLSGVARDLLANRQRAAARTVLDEMAANAREMDAWGAIAETHLRRAQNHLQSGRLRAASKDLAAGRRALRRFPQHADRERIEAELSVLTLEHQVLAEPDRALQQARALVPVVERIESAGHLLLFPRALVALANAQAAVEHMSDAEENLSRALEVYEQRRELAGTEQSRISFFATVQRTFDRMIEYQATLGNSLTALDYAERVRSRGLHDQLHCNSDPKPTSLAPLLSALSADRALIAYTVLDRKILSWRLWQSELKMLVFEQDRHSTTQLVKDVQLALTETEPTPEHAKELGEVYDLLVRPMIADLPAQLSLILVPDRELHRLPFAALLDTNTDQRLVERHPISFAASVISHLQTAGHSARNPETSKRLLAVGDPAFSPERFVLPRLPGAARESLAVSRLYPQSTLLQGENATAANLLRSLPGTQVLSLAAHVVDDPRQPLDSVLVTAKDPEHPYLLASELQQTDLSQLELAFLSTCDSAPSFPDGDREGIAGLARALLAAGTHAVVASLWPVEDAAASHIAVTFHESLLAGLAPDQALQTAQLRSLSSEQPRGEAWQPFQLYLGGPGRPCTDSNLRGDD